MDISLTVWANGNTGTYKNGDIVSADSFYDGVSEADRFILFNITDMPDNTTYDMQYRRMKKMLESAYQIGFQQGEIRRRGFRVDFRLMTQGQQQTLMQTRGITLPWSVAKTYMCKKVVTNNNDYSTDTNTLLTDEDL